MKKAGGCRLFLAQEVVITSWLLRRLGRQRQQRARRRRQPVRQGLQQQARRPGRQGLQRQEQRLQQPGQRGLLPFCRKR